MNSFPASFTLRAAVYAASPLSALRALDVPGIAVCDIIRNQAEIVARTAQLRPHVLVLWHDVTDKTALAAALLQALPACPPHVIGHQPSITDAIFDAMRLPCSPLAAASLPRREACAGRLLREIGMSPTLLGMECLIRGAALLSACPSPAPPLQYHLYPLLAQSCGITPAAVEKRIRTAIENTWLHGSLAAQNRLLGLSVSAERGKPTNSELLFRLADQICAELF